MRKQRASVYEDRPGQDPSQAAARAAPEGQEPEADALGGRLLEVYRRLLECYGPQHWWPAQEPFEVIVGAILTQSASWKNVESAIQNLRSAGALNPAALRRIPPEELSRLVYPAGYYNAKALKLKAFAQHLEKYGDNLEALFSRDTPSLRRELLSIYGVGEETADSILLYVGGWPSFVVDAYTRRILGRLGLAPQGKGYAAWQARFMEHLPLDASLFNEYHALLVEHGKRTCRREPLCPGCCLLPLCPTGRGRQVGLNRRDPLP